MKPYRFLTPANRELTAILDYLQGHSPVAAEQFANRLDKRLILLAQYPHSGHRRSRFRQDDFRYIVFGDYVIVYLATRTPLTIATILHSSRDLINILNPNKNPGRPAE